MTEPTTQQPDDIPVDQQNMSLEEDFSSWDPKRLAAYAANITQALTDEQETVKNLTNRYTSAQNWALGLALVEEIGRSLASTLDLTEVLTRLLGRTYDAIEVEDGSIMLIEEPSGDLVAQVVLGYLSEESKSFRIPRGHGIAGEVAETGVPVIVNDAKSDPRHFKGIDKETGFKTKSILCVPLLSHDKIIGVLEVFNKKSGSFTQQDQILLSSIANYAAIAIENAQLHESVVAERDRVIQAQAEVSRKLQRDLHDGPTQLVAAIQMSIDFCQKAFEHNEASLAHNELQAMYELAQRASHQMRTLLFELRPLVLETKGLVAALAMYVERRQKEDEKTTLHLKCSSDELTGEIRRMDPKVEAALFAIVQEAVNNAFKYAKADTITISLDQEGDQLRLIVADDGAGFDVSSVAQNYEDRGSYGMVNLRERVAVANGSYSIHSKIGVGTEIRVEIPL